jgi:hypothetical protein
MHEQNAPILVIHFCCLLRTVRRARAPTIVGLLRGRQMTTQISVLERQGDASETLLPPGGRPRGRRLDLLIAVRVRS